MLASNNNEYCSVFQTLVGVRPGGVASPKLFSVYVNELIHRLTISDEGIKLDTVKVDTFFYADDILVVNETKSGLQRQLKLVEENGIEYDIKYNPDKLFLWY